MRLSTTARLALLAALLVLASNLAVIGYVHVQTRNDALVRLESEVAEQADTLDAVYRSGGVAGLERAVGDLVRSGDGELLVALTDAKGRVRAGTLSGTVGLARRPVGFRVAPLTGNDDDQAAFTVRAVGPMRLLYGRRVDDSVLLHRALENALLVAGLLSALMGAAGGAVIAWYVGRRLRVIAGAVDVVAAGDLSRRAEIVSGGDSFDALARRVNMMLDRIEGLMRELQLLTDSLAHDLRSPLSRLHVKVERAITLDEGEAREAALNGLLQETDTIMRMLSLLLEIGRMEAMAGASRMDWIEPARVVTDLAEMYEPVLEDAGIAFDCRIDGPVLPLHGHRELLAQAMSNLIDNAMRHGGAGKALTVRLSTRPDELVFSVEDRGPGIAPDQEAEARRRFGRLDAARSRPGAGLGLALVEAVARLHRGRLELADNGPGLAARIVLPAGSPASVRSAP